MKFVGGVHPEERKISRHYRIQQINPPDYLYLHLSQHTGKPSIPLVKEGDYVLRGQKIANYDGAISASLHAPASGKVVGIKEVLHPSLCIKMPAIIIETDKHSSSVEFNTKYKEYHRFTRGELIAHIKECGIVGLGGAMFPTDVKLNPPKVIDFVIANGCECEPYLTSDDRVMQELYEE
ncbi:MAG: electron transport complex subunit RsxC, partial [Endomicrobia bacterium]|nr:electron transport complex subunit RsxC [Endomicrobiia bacterium]